ncbi:MAG: hypothetical protein QME59_05765 [Candidatus Hydrothermarchaeota archaeon]|nr:hypothetical protein [Candidatus Hydrothermarchaeota archaeon]
MEENYRGIIITCILGILLIGIFLTAFKPKESFSELYFEDHKNLPKKFFVNESQKIAFTVVSHEEKTKNYAYEIKIQNETYETGSFTLNPGENRTTAFDLVFQKPYLSRVEHNGTIQNTDPFPREYILIPKLPYYEPVHITLMNLTIKTIPSYYEVYIYDLVRVQVNLYYENKTSDIRFFTIVK